MLKPRYGKLVESVSDFKRMLEGMNKIQPLERKRLDEDTLDMFMTDQALVRFEQQIEHAYRAIYGSGMPISEGETASLRQMHLHAAQMYESAADDAEKEFKKRSAELKAAGHDSRVANLAKMKAHIEKLRATAAAHLDKSRPKVATATSQVSSVMHNMRSLAGLVERVQMPRDPGLSGTTRFVAGYEQMAEPFEEAMTKDQQRAGRAAMADRAGYTPKFDDDYLATDHKDRYKKAWQMGDGGKNSGDRNATTASQRNLTKPGRGDPMANLKPGQAMVRARYGVTSVRLSQDKADRAAEAKKQLFQKSSMPKRPDRR